ncbi:phosphatase PAP2 family protein [Streptomyces albidoflavus]|uniref:phosphatase PAP2 family protein n=1 Tax=Streptomyces albidoflavus TaxID=1886 RepID=UPI0021492D44|nr:phosphatase PAP2 family protein [Streptomyces albidoflavus]MCR0987046.1 phosphatase PAP2 family protein [Streptomyces albidoflavus]
MGTEPNLTRLDRLFARLDREQQRPEQLHVPRMSRHRIALFGATLAFYATIVVAVITTSWLVRLDWQLMFFRPYQQWPEIHPYLDYYVVLGQRGPTAVMVAAWLGWRSWRQHTLRPLLALGASLLLLNVTVGAAKIGMGRLGPHYATEIGANEMWQGGDIFPSGHTANAVVTWGILAYLAATPRARRHLSTLSAVVSLGVGLTTVYLGTHWLSDVLLGWAAGVLILLALPWFEPMINWAEARILAARDLLWARWGDRLPMPRPGAAAPAGNATTQAAPPATASTPSAPAERLVVEPSAQQLRPAGNRPHLAQRPHAGRAERPPQPPSAARRPPHSGDRGQRGGPSPRPVAGG